MITRSAHGMLMVNHRLATDDRGKAMCSNLSPQYDMEMKCACAEVLNQEKISYFSVTDNPLGCMQIDNHNIYHACFGFLDLSLQYSLEPSN